LVFDQRAYNPIVEIVNVLPSEGRFIRDKFQFKNRFPHPTPSRAYSACSCFSTNSMNNCCSFSLQ
jgi:hypothetical protein